MGKQFIFGRYSALSLNEKTKIASSVSYAYEDHRAMGIKSPILCSFKSVPIAYYDYPTLNNMVFPKKLWENLLKNEFLRLTMEGGSHYGEECHRDNDEVIFSNVACRVTKFWLDSDGTVLGDVDIPDTPNGNIIYNLAHLGRVGISSRGFGELRDMGDGLKEVVPDDYTHVCWDMVTIPACSRASFRVGEDVQDEVLSMDSKLRDLVGKSLDKFPNDPGLLSLYNSLGRVNRDAIKEENAVRAALLSHEFKIRYLHSKSNHAMITSALAMVNSALK